LDCFCFLILFDSHEFICLGYLQENRINDFVYLLKLAGVTCQHFISIDQSLPVLGGLSKEMAQEASNCISASVILLLECYPFVARDGHELEKFGGSTFDLLLHCLASPQSSVTSLRTLGGKLSLPACLPFRTCDLSLPVMIA
jgi:hypothetical protein